jgi:2-keto-3-deoxy-L-rhamnonate aldolase RhmA
MAQKSYKQRVTDLDTILGASIPLTTERDQLEKILEKGPYDFVSIDSQHNPLNETRLVEFCAMAKELGTLVNFRIKHTRHTYLIGNFVDLGPAGIEVPQVETEATVEEAVENFYYLPQGKRSVGGMPRLNIENYPDSFDYAERWNKNGVLWMQVESVEAVEQVYALAKPGVDCISFGPTDLSFSLKYSDHPRLKTVDDCVRHVVKTLEGTHTAVCYRSISPDNRQKYMDMGVTVILESPGY